MKIIFILLIFSLSANGLNHPKPFYNWEVEPAQPININGQTNFLTTADWVEVKLTVSAEKKITKTSILNSSGYKDFNQAQIDNLIRFERFLMPAKINGVFIDSELTMRMDHLHWRGLNRIHSEFEILDSQVPASGQDIQKEFLITINDKLKEEVFRIRQVPIESDLKVFEIDRHFSDLGDYGFVKRQPESFEQLENNDLISQIEFKNALQAYTPVDPMMSITMYQGKIMNSHEVNELLPYDKKTKHRFKRFEFNRPSFEDSYLFADFNGELALNSYTGELEFTATVLSSGRIENIKLIKRSNNERLNSIVIEALEKKYINPAYSEFKPVKDEIRVRLKLYKDI